MPSADRTAVQSLIQTSRLTLRPLAEEDAPTVHRYRSRSDVTQFLSHGALTEAETLERHRRAVACARASTSDWFMASWAMLDNQTGKLIGDGRVWNSNEISLEGTLQPGPVPKDHVLMGYVLDPEHHGKGLAREAAGAMVDWVFSERNINTVLAAVYEPNLPSRRLLEKLGFVQDQFVPASSDRNGKNLASIRMRLDRPK